MTEFEVFKKALERNGYTLEVTDRRNIDEEYGYAIIDAKYLQVEFFFDNNGKLEDVENYKTTYDY